MKIIFEFDENDSAFKDDIHTHFPNSDFARVRGFDANTFVFVAVIPITAITVEILDFIMTHIVPKKNSGRKVVIKGKAITLEGYSKNEVVEILNKIYEK